MKCKHPNPKLSFSLVALIAIFASGSIAYAQWTNPPAKVKRVHSGQGGSTPPITQKQIELTP